MGDLGYFAQDFPQYQPPAAPTVPVIPASDGAPVADPAAPPATRIDALTSALNNTYNGVAPMTSQDAQIAGSMPYVNPLRPQGNVLAVGGVTNSSSTGGTYLTADAKAAAARAEEQSGKAADSVVTEGQLAFKQAQELAAQKEHQARQLQEKAAQDLAKQDAIQKRVSGAMEQQQKDTDEYLKAQKDIDPNRMMKGGRGVLAAIASAMGAFGAAMTHSPNFAMQIIENSIQRDYQAQKDVVDSKRYKSEASGRLVQQLRSTLSDEQSVQLAHNAALKDAFAQKIEALGTKMKGTEAEQHALTVTQQLRAGAAQARAELEARAQIHAQKTVSTQIVPVAKISPYDNLLSITEDREKKRASIAKSRGENPEGEARTSQEKVVAAAEADIGIIRNLNEYRKLVKGDLFGGMNAGMSQRAAEMQQSLLL